MKQAKLFPSTLVAIVIGFSLAFFATDFARADRRIVSGTSIPLSVPGKKPIDQILATCLREETMGSLYPSLATTTPAPGTSPKDEAFIHEDVERTGDEFNWKDDTKWLPSLSYGLEFLEWKDVTTPIQRFISLDVSSVAYGPTYDETELSADFQTDAEGSSVNVSLNLLGPLPYFRTETTGHRTCSVNEWGRDACVDPAEERVSAQLVIPPEFVSSGTWVNQTTGHQTMKSFSFFRYAECLLWNWEN